MGRRRRITLGGPGPVLSSWRTLIHFIPTTLRARLYCLHFSNKETEAQRGSSLAQSHTGKKEQSQGLDPGCLAGMGCSLSHDCSVASQLGDVERIWGTLTSVRGYWEEQTSRQLSSPGPDMVMLPADLLGRPTDPISNHQLGSTQPLKEQSVGWGYHPANSFSVASPMNRSHKHMKLPSLSF